MIFDVLTLFPEVVENYVGSSIIGRAIAKGIVEVNCHNFREYTKNKHRHVDDCPYSGGKGMVIQCQPVADCLEDVIKKRGKRPHIVFMSPKGSVFNQQKAIELSKMDNIVLLCGHYEGIDQRVLDKYVDEEISVGDYVLTGGELGSMIVIDAVSRMIDGVLSDESCYTEESHFSGLLEYPQYTRPAEWDGRKVPDVLISGHHANIERWKREQSLTLTLEKRPDMLKSANLTKEDEKFLQNRLGDKCN